MERRFINTATAQVKLEKRADGKPMIVGYGAVYYDGTEGTQYMLCEGVYERVLPGAFDRAIREDDCRGLFNHDPNCLLGRTKSGTLKLSVDSKGLRYEIDPGDTTISKDLQEHLRRGDVDGSSFAFDALEERITVKRDGDNWLIYREIVSAKLYDTGPVVYPAYDSTSAAVRSANEDSAA